VAKPVWNNADRINHANHFVPRSVILNSGRPNVNSVWSNVNTGSFNGNWGSAVKTSAGYNWRPTRPNSNCNGGPTFIRTDHPLKNMVDRGIFDSRCSGHMTGNKDQLEDFKEFNGGSVTFGSSKGYITGKGRIRVGMDISEITRKPSKTNKHEHENEGVHKSRKPKLEKVKPQSNPVKLVKLWSTAVNH
ncbi:hypothetical protein Tco_0356488, partial [Tanacetum coccineum]